MIRRQNGKRLKYYTVAGLATVFVLIFVLDGDDDTSVSNYTASAPLKANDVNTSSILEMFATADDAALRLAARNSMLSYKNRVEVESKFSTMFAQQQRREHDDFSSEGGLLCVVAGTTSLNRESTMMMARSLFSTVPGYIPNSIQLSSPHVNRMRLFLYSANASVPYLLTGTSDIDKGGAYVHVGATGATASAEMRAREDDYLRSSVPPEYASNITLLTDDVMSSVRVDGEGVSSFHERRYATTLKALLLAARDSCKCNWIYLSNGRTLFMQHFGREVIEADAIHSMRFVSCRDRHARDPSVHVDDEGRTSIESSGVIVPVAMLERGDVSLKFPHRAHVAGMPTQNAADNHCTDTEWKWIIKDHRQTPVVHKLQYSKLMENPMTAPHHAPIPSKALLQMGARLPSLCAVVRTFRRDAKALPTLLSSLILNAPRDRFSIWLINGNNLTDSATRAQEEAWINDTILPMFDSYNTPPQRSGRIVSLLTFEDLSLSPEDVARIDPFGYVVTDAALRHSALSSCDYFLVTNGDNFYSTDFFANVLPHIDAEKPRTIVGVHFTTRFALGEKKTFFWYGMIDLGAAIFSAAAYRLISFSNLGQKTLDEWNFTDGRFFAKLSFEILEKSKQMIVEKVLFAQQ